MRRAWIHLGLFIAACATTFITGVLEAHGKTLSELTLGELLARDALLKGLAFAGTLMTILVCHELGHYLMARRRRVAVSLPYFIPLPPGVTLGTLGAVIRMDRPIEDRNALFDVGAAGPIAGLVVAIPLLLVGLSMSDVVPQNPDAMLEGNSLLYIGLKYIVTGHYLPSHGVDIVLHPMAFAAWVGLLVTAINLMPIGQLDGGHVAKAVLGDAHERWSKRLNVLLPIIGLSIGGVMLVQASAARPEWGAVQALKYAMHGVVPWVVWSVLLFAMRRQAGEYHPAVGDAPLTPTRRVLAFGMLVVFILVLTPVPFRPVL
ncbi:MAG: site-2 protease family protein [Kofleriaceae bacterium]